MPDMSPTLAFCAGILYFQIGIWLSWVLTRRVPEIFSKDTAVPVTWLWPVVLFFLLLASPYFILRWIDA